MIFTKKKSQAVSSIKADENGKYSFVGPHYVFDGDAKSYSAFRTRLIVLTALITALWIVGGILPSAGMLNCFYVIIPYFILLLVSGGMTVWASVRLITAGDHVRDYVFSATVEALPRRSVATLIMAVISLVAEIVFVILNGFDGRLIFTLIEFVVMAAIGAAALLLRKTVKRTGWNKVSRSLCDE